MGKPDQTKSTKTLAVTVSGDGNVNYDAIVKQGQNKNKIIATTHDAMMPKLDRLKEVCTPSASPSSLCHSIWTAQVRNNLHLARSYDIFYLDPQWILRICNLQGALQNDADCYFLSLQSIDTGAPAASA